MKKRVMTFVAACLALSVCAQKNGHTGYPITPVPFTAVKVNDAFWGQRLKASREVTIPLAFSKCEETGRYKNFEMAANPGPHNKVTGFLLTIPMCIKRSKGPAICCRRIRMKN